jgi:hypothetical protein
MHRNEFGVRQERRWRRYLPALVAASAFVMLGARQATAGTLLVSSTGVAGKVIEYNAQTGAPGDVVILPGTGGMSNMPEHMLYGPDGHLYVADYNHNSVLRFGREDGDNANHLFVPPHSGGLNQPTDMAFGPDGNLYVCSRGTNQVLKYNGHSGAFIGVFVTAGSGGIADPDAMAFGPDGNLYVTGQGNTQVGKFNGTTGAFIGGFTPGVGPGVLSVPVALRFGPDGNLYVASNATHQVIKFNGATGAFISNLVTVNDPLDIAFGPDGNLYVADHTADNVLKFNGSTGAAMGTLITAGSGGLNVPYSLVFLPPDSPRDLSVGAMSGTTLTLSWLDMSDDESNFILQRRGINSDWTTIATLPPGTVSFTDTGLTPGIPYAYRIGAVNAIGRSDSDQVLPVVTPGPLPRGVHELQAWPIGTGQVFVGWMPESGPILGYAIWRKGGGSDWAPVTQVMNASATGFIDTGLKSDTIYIYRVRVVGTNGTSEWSDEIVVLTTSPSLTAPSSLAGTVISSTKVDLTWTLGSTGETGVTVWRKIGAGSFVRIAVLPAGSTSYSDTTVTAGNNYTYQVRVNNNYYVSPFSNQVSVTTP